MRMTRNRIGTLAASVVGVFLAGTPAGAESQWVTVREGLKVHTGAGFAFRVKKVLRYQQRVYTNYRQGAWTRISYPLHGWVYSAYISKMRPMGVSRYVTVKAGLSVRTGAGTNFRVKKVLAYASRVYVVGRQGDWNRISFPLHGWVLAKYLSAHRPAVAVAGASTGNPYGLPRSSVGFLLLPASGYGFTTYISSYGRWGVPRLTNGLISMARAWKNGYPGVTGKYLNYGDMNLQNGGYFYPHQTHQDGHCVDMLPVGTGGNGSSVVVGGWGYSTYYTQKLVNLQYKIWSISVMFHNNSRISGVSYYPGHDNHVHTRIN